MADATVLEPSPAISASATSNAGLVRSDNQDCFLTAPELGLYLVLDGMGGHNGGEVASRRAREIIHDLVAEQIHRMRPGVMLERACQRACGLLHSEAKANRDLHGMGTTVVAALLRDKTVHLAHVGDSRAYLLRRGHLRQLTEDHTLVAELLARNAIKADEVQHHPYASVLSRNLGGHPRTKVDVQELELEPGDRLLLCSDGLHAFATDDAIEQVLDGAEDAAHASEDLVDLALRGGGGDNITALVLEVPGGRARANSTQLQGSGAAAWWLRRHVFLEAARKSGLARCAMAAALEEEEAVALLGGNFCEAIFHDLEHTTGIHVWTFAENLARPWIERGGAYDDVRDVLDILRTAALVALDDIADQDEKFTVSLEIAILRALIVAEMYVGGLLSERIDDLDRQLTLMEELPELPESTFASIATTPFAGELRIDPAPPAVTECLRSSLSSTFERLGEDQPDWVLRIMEAVHASAMDFAGEGDMLITARDLYGSRLLGEEDVSPLFATLSRCRSAHLQAVERQNIDPEIRATAFRRIALAHQGLSCALAVIISDAGKPVADRLRELNDETARQHAIVARNEHRLQQLQRMLKSLTSPPHAM